MPDVPVGMMILSGQTQQTRGYIYHVIIMDVVWFLIKVFRTVECSWLFLPMIGMLR
jgi:hypothetical protein